MLQGNYKPGFRAELYAKDMRIAGQTLAEYQTPAPVSSAIQQLITAMVAAGQGQEDYSALATVIFKLAGLAPQFD
jgi:2-hydroxy-3-oxopropionate reductase